MQILQKSMLNIEGTWHCWYMVSCESHYAYKRCNLKATTGWMSWTCTTGLMPVLLMLQHSSGWGVCRQRLELACKQLRSQSLDSTPKVCHNMIGARIWVSFPLQRCSTNTSTQAQCDWDCFDTHSDMLCIRAECFCKNSNELEMWGHNCDCDSAWRAIYNKVSHGSIASHDPTCWSKNCSTSNQSQVNIPCVNVFDWSFGYLTHLWWNDRVMPPVPTLHFIRIPHFDFIYIQVFCSNSTWHKPRTDYCGQS